MPLSEVQHAAAWGRRPQPAIKIRKFTPFQNAAKTVLGFLSVELPSGLVLHELRLMRGPNGRHWIALPSIKQTDKDGNPRLDAHGKPSWNAIVEFRDRASRDRFGELVLEALRRAYPEAIESESAR